MCTVRLAKISTAEPKHARLSSERRRKETEKTPRRTAPSGHTAGVREEKSEEVTAILRVERNVSSLRGERELRNGFRRPRRRQADQQRHDGEQQMRLILGRARGGRNRKRIRNRSRLSDATTGFF